MRPVLDLSLYVVTDPAAPRGPEAVALAAARGGARVVQLRDKTASDEEFLALARRLAPALRALGCALILNDRPHLVRPAGAAGAHVGQGDLPPAQTRALIGPDAVLGLSVDSLDHLPAVDPAVVDHLGVGPVRATATKPDHAAPLGWEGLAAICAAAPLPAVAIGGIKPGDAAAVRAAGAVGMAVVSAVGMAADPEAAARALRAEWEAAR